MDTVEWGNVEAGRRRPTGRMSASSIGALVLAVAGFALLAAAEFSPWVGAQAGGANGASASRLSVGLEVAGSVTGVPYQLGALALLGAVGWVLTNPAGRRRGPMGLALGLAAGELLAVVQVLQLLRRAFGGTLSGSNPGTDTVGSSFQVSVRSGVYLAIAGVLALAAAAVLRTVRWRDLAARVPLGPAAPADDRELTVTGLEPLNEAHFARE